MNNVIPELDWVIERAKCSPDSVLKLLNEQAAKDVEQRMNLRSDKEKQYVVVYAIYPAAGGGFAVSVRRMDEFMEIATFQKTPDGINVTYQDRTSFAGVLTLGNDGRCRLRVKDTDELEFWQFRKMALEPIFFNLLSELRQ